ncbi:transposase [Mogibacterium timidum]|uniref:transposase n=1 Tax=Mogibacterium timidum TaxID=35519 RepID=UPI003AB97AF3
MLVLICGILYRDIVSEYFPKAVICVDSFHVIRMINHALAAKLLLPNGLLFFNFCHICIII